MTSKYAAAEAGAKRGVRFYVFAGVFTAIPLLITVLVIRFTFESLSSLGSPGVNALFALIQNFYPNLPSWVTPEWVQSIVSAVLALLALYFLGRLATHVLGSKVIHGIEGFIAKIPLAKSVYGNTKKLLNVLQRKSDGRFDRVVLVDFPQNGMKVIGFVTAEMTDSSSGEKLAAVFLPTTPNPTSGWLEIMPVSKLIITGWTVEEALQYIISGGVSFPEKLPVPFAGPAPLKPQ